MLRTVLCVLFVFAGSAVALPVYASPWTLRQHELVLSSQFNFSAANSEFLGDGTLQVYPLRGDFSASTLSLSSRYGFTDRFEMEAKTSIRQISYEADSVILNQREIAAMNGEVPMYDLEEARSRVIDFDSTTLGVADLEIYSRYNVYRGPVVITPEVGLKVPLGYAPPQGTFEKEGSTATADDVSLGDGQVDVSLSLLAGTYVPWTRTFVRADVGYNARFGGPGHQLRANAKVGQFIGDALILFAGVRYAQTLFQGTPIGKTFVDTNPEQSAQDYDARSVEERDLYLDRDFVIVEGGAIVNLEKIEVQFGYERVLSGRNFANLTSFNIGVVTSLPDLTKAEEPAESEEEIVEEEVIEAPEESSE